MQIKKLFLQNFRNYQNETFTFDKGLNVLFGKNAQGKTNCAEAVFYLCTGASLRIRHDKQLVKMGEECAYITAEATAQGLGTCILGWFDDKEIREICSLDGAARLVVALGYAKEGDKLREKKRKDLGELVSVIE